jgi:hypothetical protein
MTDEDRLLQKGGCMGLYMKYFVLKPKGDDLCAEASRVAMSAYANHLLRNSTENEMVELAQALNNWCMLEALNSKEAHDK